MKVLVLHNAVGESPSVDERDVLTQRDAVVSALKHIGYTIDTLACSLNLESIPGKIEGYGPDVVFNLVESLGGTDRLMPLVPLLLDALQVPYTGASSDAMLATSSKSRAKKRLRDAALPTPDWMAVDHPVQLTRKSRIRQWIIKPIWEHASLDMDEDAIVEDEVVVAELQLRNSRSDHPLFAERFIDGREFNLSLLAGEVLPPAEIEFCSFPKDKPRIVGHKAKWDESSFEYQQTPRRFDFPADDLELLERLSDLAKKSWGLFQLQGFARVDFRVDSGGNPWILEVNVNPCLSPDAGFAAALQQAGLPFPTAIKRIIDEALSPCARSDSTPTPLSG